MAHPELERILQSYHGILNDYDANHISLDAATAAISQLQVVDASGWVWSIDSSSGFYTRSAPGGTPERADESQFVPNHIPGPSPMPMPGSMLQPPNVPPGPGPTPWDGAPSDPTTAAFTPPLPPPSQRRKPSRSSTRSSRSGSSFLSGLFSANRRVIIIGLVVVIIIVIAFVAKKPGTTTPTTTVPSTLPITTTSLPPTTTTQAVSTSGVPSKTTMSDVFDSLTQGETSLSSVSSSVQVPGNGVSALEHVAFFSGLADINATISFTAAHKVSGGATSTFTLRAPSSGALLYAGTAHWIIRGGTWKLATWPTFS